MGKRWRRDKKKKAASKQVAAECFGGKRGSVTSLSGRETGKISGGGLWRWGGLLLFLCHYCSTYNGPLFWKRRIREGGGGCCHNPPSLWWCDELLTVPGQSSSDEDLTGSGIGRERVRGKQRALIQPCVLINDLSKKKKEKKKTPYQQTLLSPPVCLPGKWHFHQWSVKLTEWSFTKPHTHSQCLSFSLYGSKAWSNLKKTLKIRTKKFNQASVLELGPSEKRVNSSQSWGWAANPPSFWFKQRRQRDRRRESKRKTQKKRGSFIILSMLQWSVPEALSVSSGWCLQSKSSWVCRAECKFVQCWWVGFWASRQAGRWRPLVLWWRRRARLSTAELARCPAGWYCPGGGQEAGEPPCWRPNSPMASGHRWRTTGTDTWGGSVAGRICVGTGKRGWGWEGLGKEVEEEERSCKSFLQIC